MQHTIRDARRRSMLAASCAALSLSTSLASAANAQSASAQAQPAAQGQAELAEIVVTAEKRESTAQRTPIAISTVDAKALEARHITDVRDLTMAAPNVQIYQVGAAIQLSVRGVGSGFLDPRGDPAVAASIDGLYYPRPVFGGAGLFDTERVEVLRGPQGTLYGRNAAAGAITVVTRRPSTESVSGYGRLELGNFGERNAEGALNIPLTNTLAVRVAGRHAQHDGYVADYYNDQDATALRASALWQPTSDIAIFLTWNQAKLGGHGDIPGSYPCGGVQPYSLVFPRACTAIPTPTDPVIGQKIGQFDGTLETVSLQGDFELGFATLTSITGHVHQDYSKDSIPTGAYFAPDNQEFSTFDAWTQEFRLAGKGRADHAGGLQWVMGAYYTTSDASLFITAFGGGTDYPALPATSWAGFGQAVYGVTDKLRLVGGLRYTRDKKGLEDASPGATRKIEVISDNVSYRASVEYDLSKRNLLYLTNSTGYVAGGPNGGNPDLPSTAGNPSVFFQPQVIKSWEIGSKNRFFDNRLQLNLAAYHYDMSGYQYFQPANFNNGKFLGAIQNLGDVKTYGVEVEMTWAASADDILNVSATAAHGEYGKMNFAGGPPGVPIAFSAPSGRDLANQPDWQVYIGYVHTFRLRNEAKIDASLNTHLSDGYWTVPQAQAIIDNRDYQGQYSRSDASLTYTSAGERFIIRAWVKNIEDKTIRTFGLAPGFSLWHLAPPRTYGITAEVRF